MTGPNPVDWGKYGSKIHLITERTGLRLSVGISGADVHDSQALIPLVKGVPPIRSRRGPRRRKPAKLHADKGYDYSHLRRWLSQRGIWHRIARKGVETSQWLGRHWTIERTMAWLAGRAVVSIVATSVKPSTSSPSRASHAPSSATADSPNEMTSKAPINPTACRPAPAEVAPFSPNCPAPPTKGNDHDHGTPRSGPRTA